MKRTNDESLQSFYHKGKSKSTGFYKNGKKNSEIAKLMGRSPSTISREIRRNAKKRENNSALKAEEQYRIRRKNNVRAHKLSDPACAELVTQLLGRYWSPEEIVNRLKYEENPISISTCTIYRGLQNGLLAPSLRKVLRIKGRERHGGHKKSRCGHLDIQYIIYDRPKKDQRTSATVLSLGKFPKGKRRSLTVDHGKEFVDHRVICTKLNCKVYFADPHEHCQQGTNENFNGLLRRFFSSALLFPRSHKMMLMRSPCF